MIQLKGAWTLQSRALKKMALHSREKHNYVFLCYVKPFSLELLNLLNLNLNQKRSDPIQLEQNLIMAH